LQGSSSLNQDFENKIDLSSPEQAKEQAESAVSQLSDGFLADQSGFSDLESPIILDSNHNVYHGEQPHTFLSSKANSDAQQTETT
jgi:hypothetical protein